MKTHLENGAEILQQAGDVVLCNFGGEFVTWIVDQRGDAHWGHYFGDNRPAAEDNFKARVAER